MPTFYDSSKVACYFLRSTLLFGAFVSSLLYQRLTPWVGSVSENHEQVSKEAEHECMKYVAKQCIENVWLMDANSIFACQFDIAKELDKQDYQGLDWFVCLLG